jgi:hypothetical protein
MSADFHESNLDFVFHAGWSVLQYDASSWYRDHFQACADSAAVDFLAVSAAGDLVWLVEVKDFTLKAPDSAKGPLWAIITRKVRDTLAGVLAGAHQAGNPEERAVFARAVTSAQIRVAFHCERPKHKSKLFANLPDAADLRQKLRQTLRAVDSKVLVVDSSTPPSAERPWTATWAP